MTTPAEVAASLCKQFARERINARAIVDSIREALDRFEQTIGSELGPDKDIARSVAESSLGLLAIASRSHAYRESMRVADLADTSE